MSVTVEPETVEPETVLAVPSTMTVKAVSGRSTSMLSASGKVSVNVAPSTVADSSARAASTTSAVGSLVSVSSLPASSVKVTRTLSTTPT